ncbi:FAD dependent oxidoreductase [Macleaya cordata]|uniref:FAD dependent oxidoreductase n=1 Tax=Macleaya cordata TaxID=56857 RepID=A0A200PV18_MACCD|nr:FAD dependent oxidoreductase [Macleaya cordata]
MKVSTSSIAVSVIRPLSLTSKRSTTVLVRSSSSSMEEQQQLQKPRVVVCGGGVIGVCTAFFLSKKGATVTLVEKSSVACAASGKAGGFLALDWCDGGPLSKLARASFNLHRSLALELDGPQSYGYRPLHTLSLSITELKESITSTPPTASSDSILPPWVTGPARNPSTIGTTDTTAQVHPQLFTRTLLSYAVSNHDLEVVIGELDRVEVEEGRVKSVVLKEGEDHHHRVIEADAVVLALGPWSSRLPLISSLFRVSGLKAHSIVLEPREPTAITPHALFLSYSPAQGGKPLDPEVYPRPTGEVYLCGMSAEAEVPDDPEQIVGDPESIKVLKRVAATVSSHLREGDAHVKAEQACFLPCTDDNKPVIGELPNVKGCYVATGHSCWGILNGPATGAAMAELVIDGNASIVDLTPFSPARFVDIRGKHKK